MMVLIKGTYYSCIILCITHFFPPILALNTSLLSGATRPISILATITDLVLLVEGDWNSLPGVFCGGGSNI